MDQCTYDDAIRACTMAMEKLRALKCDLRETLHAAASDHDRALIADAIPLWERAQIITIRSQAALERVKQILNAPPKADSQ